jgi:hypothetical protein
MALEQDDDEDMSETREEPSDHEDEDTSTVGSSTDALVSIDNAHTDSENEEGDAPLGGDRAPLPWETRLNAVDSNGNVCHLWGSMCERRKANSTSSSRT